MKPTKQTKPVKAWANLYEWHGFKLSEACLFSTKSQAVAYSNKDTKIVRVEIRVLGGKK